MNRATERLLSCLIFFTLLLTVGVLGFIRQNETGLLAAGELQKISFSGTFQIDGGQEQPLTENSLLHLKGHHTVLLRGHFDGEIPVNQQLMLRIDNLRVRISVNGFHIYSFGEERDPVSHSAGNVWASLVSPGISPEDTVEMELYNVYTTHGNTTFSELLGNLYAGYQSILMSVQLNSHLGFLFVALLVLSLGLICLVITGFLIRGGIRIPALLAFSLLCIFGGIWFSIDFSIQSFLVPYPVFSNTLDMISLLLMAALLFSYFSLLLKNSLRRVLQAEAALCCGLIILASITQLSGTADFYDYTLVTLILLLFSSLTFLTASLREWFSQRSEDNGNLLLSAAILFLGAFGDGVCYYWGFLSHIFWIKITFLLFLVLQLSRMVRNYREIYHQSTEAAVYQELAYRDAMTGVRNKTAYLEFMEKLDRELNAAYGIIVCDLNNLKYVNDTYGHEEGNQLIIGACRAVCRVFKQSPVFRIGGDEFAVITSGQDYRDYPELERLLEQEIGRYNETSLNGIRLGLAHGYAVYEPGQDRSYTDVFARADAAMYRNKALSKRGGTSADPFSGQITL